MMCDLHMLHTPIMCKLDMDVFFVPKQEVVRKVVKEEISTAVLDLEVQCTCLYVHVA